MINKLFSVKVINFFNLYIIAFYILSLLKLYDITNSIILERKF